MINIWDEKFPLKVTPISPCAISISFTIPREKKIPDSDLKFQISEHLGTISVPKDRVSIFGPIDPEEGVNDVDEFFLWRVVKRAVAEAKICHSKNGDILPEMEKLKPGFMSRENEEVCPFLEKSKN